MEEQENVILVASTGTFGEGVDILNINNIFITESHKSEIIISQILGRGMRLLEGKEKINIFDISDNYEYGSGYQRKNYLLRHAEERERIYKSRRFPYKKFKIHL
jgi:superfamily II DNA or RNA helicase